MALTKMIYAQRPTRVTGLPRTSPTAQGYHQYAEAMAEKKLASTYQPEEGPYLSDETIQALRELGAVLEPIYRRLIAEGYVIKNGKILKVPTIEA